VSGGEDSDSIFEQAAHGQKFDDFNSLSDDDCYGDEAECEDDEN
jgi:hypothetical protein